MSRIVYVNGEFVPEEDAKISVFDRGFLFADGVYEVTSVLDGKLVDFPGHMTRLGRSLSELQMDTPVSQEEMEAIHRRLIADNDLVEGMIYLQVTRGAADRDFAFPKDTKPSLVLFTQARDLVNAPAAATGLKIAFVDDIRWGRRDIKTVQLLAPSLCKMAAKALGCDDAWMVEDGHITEGTSNNAYIVTKDGAIVTRNLSNSILHGITRAAVLQLAAEAQIRVEERAFTPDEARDAQEAFVTAASSFVMPVVEVDGVTLGNGKPGPIAKRLRELYVAQARAAAI
ncbi:D-amino-acid transaminase [Pontivivens nitratireducens]|uniref:Probable branched-chain-amino-acid aminotransferase n=1 Tax=Pontivivens nitratireducens TaxID=2758038 RepID=A0A6G7VPI4_9RHOB|nr:D-amino-acid transaminase [Pontibrevibacter nitratireducens]QIK41768.1 D-amino-acid transaminase [Pontibrevibacter nitratireducens]